MAIIVVAKEKRLVAKKSKVRGHGSKMLDTSTKILDMCHFPGCERLQGCDRQQPCRIRQNTNDKPNITCLFHNNNSMVLHHL